MRTIFINLKSLPGRGLLALAIGFMLVSQVGAQDLLEPIYGTPALDQKQQHYLKTISENPINESLRFVEVNLGVLKNESFTFNPDVNLSYTVNKSDRGSKQPGMTSWCGRIPGYGIGDGDINMVIKDDDLVGHFVADEIIYGLTPLGNGMHVIYVINSSAVETEECGKEEGQNLDTYPEGIDTKAKPDVYHPDITSDNSEAKASGDCRIRVLVAFTNSARLQYTSILAEINNLINIANAAYNFGSINFNIELASAYQTTYTESGDLDTDLGRWRGTSSNDVFMNEVHTNRILWRADQCALIVNDGGGIAYLSLDYGNQFSITGTGNFGVFTFHHELGHNQLCTHDLVNTDQPGTAPYAGWGNPQGCFRTIMAYQQACGTGTCGRVNVFSRSVGTYNCGGTNYIIGGSNNRNRDRLVLSRNSIINHEVSPNSSVYGANYVWLAQSAVHMAANNNFGYSSTTNLFEMRSGSEGSFRATDYVTLGEGFWARSGSDFTAYLDNCPALVAPDQFGVDEPGPSDIADVESATDKSAEHAIGAIHDINVFPNPFSQNTFVEFHVHDAQPVSLTVYDMLGKVVLQPMSKVVHVEGVHQIELHTSSLPNGVYLISVESNGEKTVKRVVKTN